MRSLKPNHKRALFSTLFLMEKLAEEMEELFNTQRSTPTRELVIDLTDEKRKSLLENINILKEEIKHLMQKYELNKQQLSESNFVNARKTKAWEMLHNSKSKSLNAFGKFPEDLVDEYDGDINRLLDMVNNL